MVLSLGHGGNGGGGGGGSGVCMYRAQGMLGKCRTTERLP